MRKIEENWEFELFWENMGKKTKNGKNGKKSMIRKYLKNVPRWISLISF